MPSDYQRDPSEEELELKRLLFARELALLEELKARADRVDAQLGVSGGYARDMEDILVEMLRGGDARDRGRAAAALAPLLAAAVRSEAAAPNSAFRDALRPIAGGLAWGSIAGFFGRIARAIDHVLDVALSPTRWRARISALFSGESSSEALRRLRPEFQADAYLLADPRNGEILAFGPESASSESQDAAAMLDAARTHARQAARGVGGGLRRAEIDGASIYLHASPDLIVAVRVRGPRPEDIDGRMADALAGFYGGHDLRQPGGRQEASLAQSLEARLRWLEESASRAIAPPPWRGAAVLALVGLAAVGFAGHMGYDAWRDGRLEARANAVIDGAPELAGFDIRAEVEGGALRVAGLAPDGLASARLADALAPLARDADLDLAMAVTALPKQLPLPAPPADLASNDAVADLSLRLYALERALADATTSDGAEVAESLAKVRAEAAEIGRAAEAHGRKLQDLARQMETNSARIETLALDADTPTAPAAGNDDIAALRAAVAELELEMASAEAAAGQRLSALDDKLASSSTGEAIRRIEADIAEMGAAAEERFKALETQIAGASDAEAIARLESEIKEVGAAAGERLASLRQMISESAEAVAAAKATTDANAAALDEAAAARRDAFGALTRQLEERVASVSSALDRKITAATADRATQEEVATLSAAVGALEGSVAALRNELTAVADARTPEDALTALQSRVASVEEGQASAATDAAAALEAAAGADEGAKTALMRAESAEAEAARLAAAIAIVQADVRALKSAAETLEGGLAQFEGVSARADALSMDVQRLNAVLRDDAKLDGLTATNLSAAAADPEIAQRLDDLEARAGEAIALLDQRIDTIATKAAEPKLTPDDAVKAALAPLQIRFGSLATPADEAAAEEVLGRVAAIALTMPETLRIRIIGYADSDGTVDANRITSKRRSDWVFDSLSQLGVPAERMISVGRGAERLLSPDASDGSPNRRVEFEAFYANGRPS